MIALTGLHLLLTYQCLYECDHCFVWGSPHQKGAMTLGLIHTILDQAAAVPSVRSIAFEGGEPFLYYPILLHGVREATARGYATAIVTNAYWATTLEDAVEWLAPLAGKLESLALSSDCYHGDDGLSPAARNAAQAAAQLGVRSSVLSVALPEGPASKGTSGVMYRGRAAVKLSPRATQQPSEALTACPHEDLRTPARVHVDSFGYLHLCQGLCLGNLLAAPLAALCRAYAPDAHPIVGPLLADGPLGLVRRYGLDHRPEYADACQMCYEARLALRSRFPEYLAPDAMYGVV